MPICCQFVSCIPVVIKDSTPLIPVDSEVPAVFQSMEENRPSIQVASEEPAVSQLNVVIVPSITSSIACI